MRHIVLKQAESLLVQVALEELAVMHMEELLAILADQAIGTHLEEEDVVAHVRVRPAALRRVRPACAHWPPLITRVDARRVRQDHLLGLLARQLSHGCAHLPLEVSALVVSGARVVHVVPKEGEEGDVALLADSAGLEAPGASARRLLAPVPCKRAAVAQVRAVALSQSSPPPFLVPLGLAVVLDRVVESQDGMHINLPVEEVSVAHPLVIPLVPVALAIVTPEDDVEKLLGAAPLPTRRLISDHPPASAIPHLLEVAALDPEHGLTLVHAQKVVERPQLPVGPHSKVWMRRRRRARRERRRVGHRAARVVSIAEAEAGLAGTDWLQAVRTLGLLLQLEWRAAILGIVQAALSIACTVTRRGESG